MWIDADGDGFQDPGEAGIGGVTVSLLVDSNGDGIYGGAGDNPAVTTQTDAAGNYIFDGLSKGAYVVQVTPPAGYTQTGDPDDTPDHQTTEPVSSDLVMCTSTPTSATSQPATAATLAIRSGLTRTATKSTAQWK